MLLRISDRWEFSLKEDSYVVHSQSLGTLWKKGQKECKNQKIGEGLLNASFGEDKQTYMKAKNLYTDTKKGINI